MLHLVAWDVMTRWRPHNLYSSLGGVPLEYLPGGSVNSAVREIAARLLGVCYDGVCGRLCDRQGDGHFLGNDGVVIADGDACQVLLTYDYGGCGGSLAGVQGRVSLSD